MRTTPLLEDDSHLREYLLERLAWLVRLRWIAVVGIVVTVGISWRAGLLEGPQRFLWVALTMTAYNMLFWTRVRGELGERGVRTLRRTALLQILLDLAALAILIHQAGGAENPFAIFFAFHMAIAAMLLSLPQALLVGSIATLFYCTVLVGETYGWLVHYPLLPAHRAAEPRLPLLYLMGQLLAFALMLFGVIYFVYALAVRYRQAEAERLERERLARARERLARIGEISAGVAHNIRNPLHGVMNCVDILRSRTGGDGALEKPLDLMKDGLTRIETVTQRLLTLSRETPLERKLTDVNALLEETARFARMRGGEREVIVEYILGEIPPASLDGNRLGEALLNIVDNAIDASPPGERVVLESSSPAEGLVRLAIRDHGEGIPEDLLSRIFDPFFTTKAVGEGSGLGLAIAKRIVEEHGGTITVQGRPEGGTEVQITLPALSGAEGQEAGCR